METESTEALRESLRRFLEVHCKTKILTADPGQLSMYILHAKNQASKPRDRTILYLLLRLQEKIVDQSPDEKARVIGEFLISELNAFYKQLKTK